MLEITEVVLPSEEMIKFAIQGMRNPMNSWDKSDDGGENDLNLMSRLSKAGTEHRKFMRQITIACRITAPMYWWKEIDTYKVGTVRNSTSTMHKIQAKEFEMSDFSVEHLLDTSRNVIDNLIYYLNYYRDIYNNGLESDKELVIQPKNKDIWWQMIQMLPSSYNQTSNMTMNYEVLANIYKQRRNHKLDEWQSFCNWIETLPYAEIITGGSK